MRLGLVLTLGLLGCSADPTDAGPPAKSCGEDPTQPSCSVRLDECPLGVPLKGGGCDPVGVPKDGCGVGATSDGKGGCAPILPATACKKGEYAVPGETACHLVSPCPSSKWGDAPSSAVHVDRASTASPADGTEAKPFPTLGEAVAAAARGALIVVAEGSYEEDVAVTQPLEIRGVCPEKVEVVGQLAGVDHAAFWVTSDLTISGLSIRGASHAIYARRARLDAHHLWIHDVNVGVGVEQTNAVSTSQIHDLLIESAEIGLTFTGGAPITERVEVRSSKSGAFARYGADKAKATFRRVLFDKDVSPAVLGTSAEVIVEDSVIRAPVPDGGYGIGVGVYDEKEHPGACGLTARRTVITSTTTMALASFPRAAGTPFEVDGVTISGVRKNADGFGAALFADTFSIARVQRSVLRDLDFTGAVTWGGKLSLDHVLVQDVTSTTSTPWGVGVSAFIDPDGNRPTLDVVSSRIERVVTAGVWLEGGTGTVIGSAIDTVASDDALGDGVVTASWQLPPGGEGDPPTTFDATMTIDGTWIGHAHRAGLSAFASTVTVQDSSLLCNGMDLEINPTYGGGLGTTATPKVTDVGGNRCGCASPTVCKAQMESIEPVTQPRPKKPF